MKRPKNLTKKRIFLPPNKHKAIRAETDCGYSSVFQALNYRSDSAKAQEIRRLAFDYGAKVIIETIRPMTEEDIIQ